MKAILAECLLFDTTRRLAPFRLTIYTLIVAATAIVVERDVITREHPFTTDGHAITSLELGLNTSICRKPSTYAGTYHPAYLISCNAWASYVPARPIMAAPVATVCYSS